MTLYVSSPTRVQSPSIQSTYICLCCSQWSEKAAQPTGSGGCHIRYLIKMFHTFASTFYYYYPVQFYIVPPGFANRPLNGIDPPMLVAQIIERTFTASQALCCSFPQSVGAVQAATRRTAWNGMGKSLPSFVFGCFLPRSGLISRLLDLVKQRKPKGNAREKSCTMEK